MKKRIFATLFQALAIFAPLTAFASEVEIKIPELTSTYNIFGSTITGVALLGWGMVIAVLGMLFGLWEFRKTKRLPAHQSLLDVSQLIYETCKTYLFQQGKFLIVLELFIGGCIFYYFAFLQNLELPKVFLILLW